MNNEEQKTKGERMGYYEGRQPLCIFDDTSRNLLRLEEAAKLLKEIRSDKTGMDLVESVILKIDEISHRERVRSSELFEEITKNYDSWMDQHPMVIVDKNAVFNPSPDSAYDILKNCPKCGEPLTILPNEKEWTTKFCRNCPWNITKKGYLYEGESQ